MAIRSATSAVPASRGAAPQPIRVVIVDDSAVIRGLTKKWLAADPEVEVAASYSNGLHAVTGIGNVQADVVILDIEMPEMDGLTALPKILEKQPNLKVIIASTLSKRNADISLRALSLGAADYIAKPDTSKGLVSAESYQRDLLDKVKALGRAKGPSRRATMPGAAAKATPRRFAHDPSKVELRKCAVTAPRAIVIGSSTGGPQALTTVMEMFKGKRVNVPVLSHSTCRPCLRQSLPSSSPAFLACLARKPKTARWQSPAASM